jgi:serine/threonine protein kinase
MQMQSNNYLLFTNNKDNKEKEIKIEIKIFISNENDNDNKNKFNIKINKTSIKLIHIGNKSKIFKFFCEENNIFLIAKTFNIEFREDGDYENYINQKIRDKKFSNILGYKGFFYSNHYIFDEYYFEENKKCCLMQNKKGINLIFEYSQLGNLKYFLGKNPSYFKSKINIRNFLIQILSAIKTFEDNKFVHGDIKEENILLFLNKNNEIIFKISDFEHSYFINENTNSFLSINRKEMKYFKCNNIDFVDINDINLDYFDLMKMLFELLFYQKYSNHLIYNNINNINTNNLNDFDNYYIFENHKNNYFKTFFKNLLGYNNINNSNNISNFKDIFNHIFFYLSDRVNDNPYIKKAYNMRLKRNIMILSK